MTAAVAAGKHVRIEGPHGVIHVWVPPSYHADTGATIIYLHGYYDDADSSYIGHHLPEQFAMSAFNAMFIVPETPSAQKTPINYPDLGQLLQLVEDKTGVSRGMALTVGRRSLAARSARSMRGSTSRSSTRSSRSIRCTPTRSRSRPGTRRRRAIA